jgi:hypothetical protein
MSEECGTSIFKVGVGLGSTRVMLAFCIEGGHSDSWKGERINNLISTGTVEKEL